jgi:hypothetical protein
MESISARLTRVVSGAARREGSSPASPSVVRPSSLRGMVAACGETCSVPPSRPVALTRGDPHRRQKRAPSANSAAHVAQILFIRTPSSEAISH